jgi:hypothetical protein
MPSRQPADTPCPEPGCGHVSPNRHALGAHARTTHHKGLKDWIDEGLIERVPQGRAAHQTTLQAV